jgi:hypothetical protein
MPSEAQWAQHFERISERGNRVPLTRCTFGAEGISFFEGETETGFIVDAITAIEAAKADKGLKIPEATENLILAQVMGESNFGRSGTLGGNDWGAMQAGMHRNKKPTWIGSFQTRWWNTKGVGGLAHRDSVPATGGKAGYSFVAYYRVYPSQYIAAVDFVVSNGWIGLSNPPSDPTDYATRAYLSGYFGGFHGGARPVGQRSFPLNDAEEANIADYAAMLNRNAGIIAQARKSGLIGRDPKTIDFPSIVPLWERLSAGLVQKGASKAAMIAAAKKAFPPGSQYGDYSALESTNGLAWLIGPPPGYNKAGQKSSGIGKLFAVGGLIAAGAGAAYYASKR